MEIAKVEPCADVTNNAVVVYNVQTRMINKVDFATSMKYNLTRSAASVSAVRPNHSAWEHAAVVIGQNTALSAQKHALRVSVDRNTMILGVSSIL